jgi:dTDP-4-dehydrorhamnose 3,5-epimerase
MDQINPDIIVTPLKQIFHPKGNVYHALKRSDPGFVDFGEAYFTTVICNEVKGWKKHTRMVMNLAVPVGQVRFFIYNEATGKVSSYDVGQDNYVRLTVPPGFWMAFRGLGAELNLVMNIASIEHDPAEATNVPLETYPFFTEL